MPSGAVVTTVTVFDPVLSGTLPLGTPEVTATPFTVMEASGTAAVGVTVRLLTLYDTAGSV
jgi:spore maturation protein SpmB